MASNDADTFENDIALIAGSLSSVHVMMKAHSLNIPSHFLSLFIFIINSIDERDEKGREREIVYVYICVCGCVSEQKNEFARFVLQQFALSW